MPKIFAGLPTGLTIVGKKEDHQNPAEPNTDSALNRGRHPC